MLLPTPINRRALLIVGAMLTLAATPQAAGAEPGPWSAPVRVARAPGVYDVWVSLAGNGVLASLCCDGFGPGVPGTRLALSDTDGRLGAVEGGLACDRRAARGR